MKYTLAQSDGSNPVYSANLVGELSKFIAVEVLTSLPDLFVNIQNVRVRSLNGNIGEGIVSKVISLPKQWRWMNHTYDKFNTVVAINPFEATPFAKFRQITVVHDLIPLVFPGRYPLAYMYYSLVLPLALKASVQIVTVSENTKKDLMNFYGVSESKITVIYNGIGYDFACDTCGNRNNILEKIKGSYLLYVGNQSYHKNVLRLLHAYKLLGQRCQEKLVIVGKSHRRTCKAIGSYCKSMGLADKIVFLGTVSPSELATLYQNAKVLAFPSLYEGFGLPPLEAMYNKLPVVASNVSSIPEICGDAVYYVNPYDPVDISMGIYEVLTNKSLRHNLIQKGLGRIQMFSWKNAARNFLKVIENVSQKSNAVSK